MTDIVERLRFGPFLTKSKDEEAATEIERLRAENEKLNVVLEGYREDARNFLVRLDGLNALRAENEKLRAAMHDIYEVYAGSEGFIPQTCPEAYLQGRVKEMADIAAKHKCAAALKETDNG